MAVTKIKPVKSTLSKALDYIQNPDKTDGKMLVSSFGCSYETADIEFEYTLSQALQKGNNLAFHLIQSFEPGEVDYETAHKIGKQLADAVTKGQHEYVLTTHIDKGHVHNHIIFCAVNFVDHHKYNSNKRSYYGIRNMSDRLCRENGLSVIVPKKGNKGKSYAEYQAEKTGTSWKGKLKIAVDALIPQVSSFEELLQRLQAAGYEIKPGKYVSCRAPGQERFTRLKTLGADYTEEAIRERIGGKRARAVKAPRADRGGVSLLIDIENSIKAAQSKGYEHWAKIHNLKQAAKTMNFLTENKIEQYADLVSRIEEVTAESEQASHQRTALIVFYLTVLSSSHSSLEVHLNAVLHDKLQQDKTAETSRYSHISPDPVRRFSMWHVPFDKDIALRSQDRPQSAGYRTPARIDRGGSRSPECHQADKEPEGSICRKYVQTPPLPARMAFHLRFAHE